MSTVDINQLNEEISFLDFGEIAIDSSDKSLIVWAPNGTGKSQITGALQRLCAQTVQFADNEQSQLTFKNIKKKLEITPETCELDALERRRQELVSKLDAKGRLRAVGVTTKACAALVFPGNPTCTTHPEVALEEFDADGAARLLRYVEADDLKFFVHNRERLQGVKGLEKDACDLKNAYIRKALDNLEKAVDCNTQICPVCGTDLGRSVLEEIDRREKELSAAQDGILLDYVEEHPSLTMIDAKRRLEKLASCKATEGATLSAVVCGGSVDLVAEVEAEAREYREVVKRINELQGKRREKYDELTHVMDRLSILFKTVFRADGVAKDDQKLSVSISMPRNVSTYSSGERNLMQTMVTLAQFQASDRPLLIFDDPLSSLDKDNQYATMFELLLAAAEGEKRVIVFTHNMDCITIAQSQRKGIFKYVALERLDGKLYANELPNDLFESPKVSFISGHAPQSNALGADLLLSYADQILSPKEATGELGRLLKYVDAAIKRESGDEKSLHSLVHYAEPYTDAETGLSNEMLIGDIDGFSNSHIKMDGFVYRSVQKIYYLIAMRVWVERRIYEEFPSLRDGKEKSIGQLIGEVGDDWEKGRGITGNSGPSRRYLNSIKTMLNQSVHGLAQVAPFDYAVNLSSDRLCRKIDEIKEQLR